MPDFLGHEQVILRPGTVGYPLSWTFSTASGPLANDGSLPFGTTISSATVTIYSEAGVNITSTVLVTGSVQISGLTVAARLSHPGTAVSQRATAVITCTLNTGAVLVFDCRRILIDGVVG